MDHKMVAIFFTLVLGFGASAQENKVSLNGGKFTVEWKLDDVDKTTIHFTVTVTDNGNGWFGVGFSKINEGMKQADMVIGEIDPGGVKIEDYWSESKSQPVKDTQQDLTAVSSNHTPTSTVMKFTRKLNTGGNSQDIALEGGGIYVLWAVGDNPTLKIHSARGYSAKTFRFDGGTDDNRSGSVHLTYFKFPLITIFTLVINMF